MRSLTTLLALLCLAAGIPARGDEAPGTNWINAKEAFGLVGDGVADDSDGLQQAFHAGKPVYLPNGVYRTTRTIGAGYRTKVYGGGGNWNPQDMTVLLYDGPEGGRVLNAMECAFFQMQQVTIDGNHKAGIGIYWMYGTHECCLEDVSIIGTTQHGLYVTKSWYAFFTRLVVRDNEGNGITLDNNRDPGLAKGPVNYVTFSQCNASNNGKGLNYDGDTVFDVGYGFGSFGCNTVINVLSCVFENNAGAGVYLADHPVCFLFQGCYIEFNGRGLDQPFAAEYGPDWLGIKERKPLGRVANIIEDTGGGPWSVVFDTCYVHDAGGVWLRGQGRNNMIEFRNLVHPSVIWSEHGNWVLINSQKPPVGRRPGVLFHPAEGGFDWYDPIPGPSGHPGYVIDNGVRRLYPYSADGFDLYVDSAAGDDRHDGRTPETAWRSLEKAASLFADTTLDTPATIHVTGNSPVRFDLHNVNGQGTLTLACAGPVTLEEGRVTNVTCRFVVQGNDQLTVRRLHVRRCPEVRMERATFEATGRDGALILDGSTGIVLDKCQFTAASDAEPDPVALVAAGNSRVALVGATMADIRPEVVAQEGATITVRGSRAEAWQCREEGGAVIFVK